MQVRELRTRTRWKPSWPVLAVVAFFAGLALGRLTHNPAPRFHSYTESGRLYARDLTTGQLYQYNPARRDWITCGLPSR